MIKKIFTIILGLSLFANSASVLAERADGSNFKIKHSRKLLKSNSNVQSDLKDISNPKNQDLLQKTVQEIKTVKEKLNAVKKQSDVEKIESQKATQPYDRVNEIIKMIAEKLAFAEKNKLQFVVLEILQFMKKLSFKKEERAEIFAKFDLIKKLGLDLATQMKAGLTQENLKKFFEELKYKNILTEQELISLAAILTEQVKGMVYNLPFKEKSKNLFNKSRIIASNTLKWIVLAGGTYGLARMIAGNKDSIVKAFKHGKWFDIPKKFDALYKVGFFPLLVAAQAWVHGQPATLAPSAPSGNAQIAYGIQELCHRMDANNQKMDLNNQLLYHNVEKNLKPKWYQRLFSKNKNNVQNKESNQG